MSKAPFCGVHLDPCHRPGHFQNRLGSEAQMFSRVNHQKPGLRMGLGRCPDCFLQRLDPVLQSIQQRQQVLPPLPVPALQLERFDLTPPVCPSPASHPAFVLANSVQLWFSIRGPIRTRRDWGNQSSRSPPAPLANPLARQGPIRTLCLGPMHPSPFCVLPRLRLHIRDLLKTRMEITAYNHPARLLLPSPRSFSHNPCTQLEGADAVMSSGPVFGTWEPTDPDAGSLKRPTRGHHTADLPGALSFRVFCDGVGDHKCHMGSNSPRVATALADLSTR